MGQTRASMTAGYPTDFFLQKGISTCFKYNIETAKIACYGCSAPNFLIKTCPSVFCLLSKKSIFGQKVGRVSSLDTLMAAWEAVEENLY